MGVFLMGVFRTGVATDRSSFSSAQPMLQALELAVRLLEKSAVLVGTALVMVILRPAEVWLGETGPEASLRRRLFLVAALGALAVWGVFLGFEVGGVRFNVRMIGVLVAGYLGGAWVGLTVGAIAGLASTVMLPSNILFAMGASTLDGLLAGIWGRQIGTRPTSAVLGAVAIQIAHYLVLGLLLALAAPPAAAELIGQFELHAANVAANTVGVAVFVGLLGLVGELERARNEARESRAAARTARLEALRYQIRPHFLFNLLNTLAYLIRTDPSRARELTLELADYLRYTVSQSDGATTLDEELDQLQRYVDLERARFGDGLRFEVGPLPDPQLADLDVPPLILQPLVENAIRHGAQDGSVNVRLEIERSDDSVRLHLLDDGPGPSREYPAGGELPPEGVGLGNVRERLRRFYRGDAELELRVRDAGAGARATIAIPLDPSGRGAGLKEQAREQLRKVVS